MLNAAQLALFDMASADFELMPYDTAATGGASAAAHAVVRDGAQIILGPVFADDVRAVKPIAATANINVVAFSTDWSLAGGNTFIMGFLPFDQIDRITQFAARRNISSAGLLTDDTDYGRMVASIFRRASAENRIALARAASVPATGKDTAGLVGTFVAPASGTNAIPFQSALISLGGRAAVDVSVEMNKAGAPPSLVRRLGTGLFDDPALWREASLNGAWFAAPDPAGRMRFQKDYTATYGDGAPPRIATLAYDATALAVVLAARGGYTKSALMNPNGFAGIDGIFRFRQNGMVERGLAVLEISAGSVSVIDAAPKSFK
jgi:ABC-type branched-subunit amino acid transport system substrate-binding protein